MQPLHLLYVVALFGTAVGGILMAAYAQQHWKIAPARPFVFLMGCVAWWGLFAGLSAVAPTEEAAVFLGVPARFSAVIFITPAGLIFTLAFRGWTHWLKPRRYIPLLIIPTITLLLNFTGSLHNLLIYDVSYLQVGGIWVRNAWSQGVWFQYVHSPYSYLLLLMTIVLLFQNFRQSRYPYRQQSLLILIGALAPAIASLMITFNVLSGPDYDIIMMGFLFMGITFGWALSRYQLLDIMPIARSTVIENMNDPLLILDDEDRVLELNHALYSRLNVSRRQAIGKKLEDLFAAWPDLVARYKGLSEGRIVITVPANDRLYYFDVQISPILKEGEQVGRMISWRDITEQKTTELALEASLGRMAQLTLIAESLSDFTHLPDLFQTIVDRVAAALPANRVSLIVFDKEMEEVSDFVAGGEGSGLIKHVAFSELMEGLSGWVIREKKAALSLKSVPDNRESTAVQQRRLETQAGSIIVVPLIYLDRILGTMTAINQRDQRDFDATDVDFMQAMASQAAVAIENNRLYEQERQNVEELQETNEALQAFSHMVAHDLKSPLSILVGYGELIMMNEDERLFNLEEVRLYVHRMLNTSHKMSSIINSMLMLANIRRQEKPPRVAFRTESVLEEVLIRLNWDIDNYEAEVVVASDWPIAVGYEPWVEEIWVNYISNALKYGGKKPVIELGFDEVQGQAGDEVLFWVKDSGPGITAEEQAQLFKEFSRVGENTAKGHGLGLSIVQRITERMSGRVGVESQPGEGSKFYFTLPKAVE